jgi:hypothetical protein
VNVYVPEHEHHRKRVAFERNVRQPPHCAVRAVAADDIGEGRSFMRSVAAIQRDAYAIAGFGKCVAS